jgi:hypothetical protein
VRICDAYQPFFAGYFASHYGKDIGKYLVFNQSETGKFFSPVRGGGGDEQTFASAIFV